MESRIRTPDVEDPNDPYGCPEGARPSGATCELLTQWQDVCHLLQGRICNCKFHVQRPVSLFGNHSLFRVYYCPLRLGRHPRSSLYVSSPFLSVLCLSPPLIVSISRSNAIILLKIFFFFSHSHLICLNHHRLLKMPSL